MIVRVLLTIALLFVVKSTCCSEIIFEDNFDSHPDWQPRPSGITNDASPSGGVVSCDYESCTTAPPTGWDYFRVTGLWWGPTYNDTLRITNQTGRGGSGKSFIVYNESNLGASGDGWGADGILAKLLPQDKAELYVQYYLRTQSGWSWKQNERIGVKTFRSAHFDKTGSMWSAFSGGTRAPIMIYDLLNSSDVIGQKYGVEQSAAFRCDPQSTDYYCPNSPAGQGLPAGLNFYKTAYPGGAIYADSDDPHTAGLWADTNWHKFTLHLKMNTYAGSGTWNADGVYEAWYDGVLQYSRLDIKWIDSGSDSSIGWNTIELGGNAYNTYSDPINKSEQWYAIDDVVVSTTPIPDDYEIGGATPPAILPTSFRIPGSGPYGIVQ